MMITIPAWINDQYVSTTELLLIVGRFCLDLDWYLDVQEAALEKGSDILEGNDPSRAMSIYELLEMVVPSLQIVDGEIVAKRRGEDSIVILFKALDSTTWEIETEIKEVGSALTEYFSITPNPE